MMLEPLNLYSIKAYLRHVSIRAATNFYVLVEIVVNIITIPYDVPERLVPLSNEFHFSLLSGDAMIRARKWARIRTLRLRRGRNGGRRGEGRRTHVDQVVQERRATLHEAQLRTLRWRWVRNGGCQRDELRAHVEQVVQDLSQGARFEIRRQVHVGRSDFGAAALGLVV